MSKELEEIADRKGISFCIAKDDGTFPKHNLIYKVTIPISAYVSGLKRWEFEGVSWEEAEADARQYLESLPDKSDGK